MTATESVTVEKARGRRPAPQRVAVPLDKAVGVVRLRGLPRDVVVTVDGTEVSFLDNRIEIEPGAHELVVTTPTAAASISGSRSASARRRSSR